MAIYPTLNALAVSAKSAANGTHAHEVAHIVQAEIAKQQQLLVYNTYSPLLYNRRNSLGNQFTIQPTAVGLRIYDSAAPAPSVFGTSNSEPGFFAQWINDGNVPNVFNSSDYPWMHARPFYVAAAETLQNSAELRRVAAAGILARL